MTLVDRHRSPAAAVLWIAAALFSWGWAGGAEAAPITRTYDFEAVDLQAQIFDQGVWPVTDPVFGRVTVTFDPQGPDVVDRLEGFSYFSINVAVASPVAFSYAAASDILSLGGAGGGVEGGDVADFILRIGDASSAQPVFLGLSYNNRREFWIAGSGTVSLVNGPGLTVPEPQALGVFALGLLILVLFRRRPYRGSRSSSARPFVQG